VGAGFGVDKVDERLFSTGARVGFRSSGAFGEELERWVGRDVLSLGSGFRVFGLGVDFGNQDGRFGGEVCSDLLPNRRKGFAV
jgi:hypothetical protein